MFNDTTRYLIIIQLEIILCYSLINQTGFLFFFTYVLNFYQYRIFLLHRYQMYYYFFMFCRSVRQRLKYPCKKKLGHILEVYHHLINSMFVIVIKVSKIKYNIQARHGRPLRSRTNKIGIKITILPSSHAHPIFYVKRPLIVNDTL